MSGTLIHLAHFQFVILNTNTDYVAAMKAEASVVMQVEQAGIVLERASSNMRGSNRAPGHRGV